MEMIKYLTLVSKLAVAINQSQASLTLKSGRFADLFPNFSFFRGTSTSTFPRPPSRDITSKTMSLYYDAAPLLLPQPDQSGSLKSRVFSSIVHKAPPKQIFALVSEASKWSPVLSEVIEKSQLLQLERKVRVSNCLQLGRY